MVAAVHRSQADTEAAIAKAEFHYFRVTKYPKNITRSSVHGDLVFLYFERSSVAAVYAVVWGKNRVDVRPTDLKGQVWKTPT